MKIHRLFIRGLISIIICLTVTQLGANATNFEQLNCDSLNALIGNIFDQDLFENQSVRLQVPELHRLMEERNCEGLPNAKILLGIIHFNRKEPVMAKRLFLWVDSLLSVRSPESRAYIRSQLWLGLTDLQEDRFESANLYFDKSLRLSEKAGFKKGILQAYINMGTANIAQDNLEKAELVLNKALAVNEEIQNRLWIGYAYLNLGRIYMSRQDYDRALEYTRQSERIWEELQFPKGLYYSNLSLASIDDKLNQIEERGYHLRQALQYAEKDSTINPHNTYIALGYYYQMYSEEQDLARRYFERALHNSQAITDQQLTDLATILLDIYAAEQDIASIKQLNASLLEIYKSRAELARIEAMKWQSKEVALENQINENSSLREIQLENELKLQQRNLLLLFALALVLVFVGVAYLQYRTAAQKRKLVEKIQSQHEDVTRMNRELFTQKEQIEQQNRTILETQDQLIIQEKLASLGQLTAGIAHEIKNPLNFIINFAEGSHEVTDELSEELSLTKEDLRPEQFELFQEMINDLRQNSSDIEKSGKKIDRIVHSMMDHARDTEDNWQAVDINELLEENANLAYHSYRATDPTFSVSFEMHFAPDLPQISALPLHLGRVFLNIINNACYAVNQKQKEIKGDYQPVIRLLSKVVPNGVEVRIWDNGPGIPPKVIRDIFTPFFTTKPTGSGNTGLGLSISYDIIVKEHQGDLVVNSEPNQFTEFRIFLPQNNRLDSNGKAF